jgi:hypothetical protein
MLHTHLQLHVFLPVFQFPLSASFHQ